MTENEWQDCLRIISDQLEEMTKAFDELGEELAAAEDEVARLESEAA